MKTLMVEQTAGKKLSGARLAKGLSIDAAAHATKMRPDKILALENDDFTRFGSIAYAKSFLLMYSRFLGVDVSTELRDLDSTDHRVNVQDYQYLNNAPAPAKEQAYTPVHRGRTKPPSILPLLGFVVICFFAGAYLYLKAQWNRLELGRSAAAPTVEVVTSNSAPATPAPTVKADTTEAPETAAAPVETAAAETPAPSAPAAPKEYRAERRAAENHVGDDPQRPQLPGAF